MRFLSAFSVIAFSLILGGVALAAAPLDGTEWRVEVTPKGFTIPFFIDRVSFKEGKFHSRIFEAKGFLASPYNNVPGKGAPIVWDAKQTSDSEGGLTWHGEMTGDAMKGTLIWKQADGKVVSHTLVGTRVTEEPAPPAQPAEPAPPAAPAPAPKPKAKTPAPKTKKTP